MTIAAGSLPLHGQDGILLCWRALNDKAWAGSLAPLEEEEAIAFLMVEAWQIALEYDVEQDRALEKGLQPRFADYALYILRLRADSWYRDRDANPLYRGHRGFKPKPRTVSFEEEIDPDDTSLGLDRERDAGILRRTGSLEYRMVEPLRSGSVDPAENCDADFRRTLERGDREEPRTERELRQNGARGIAA